MKQYKYLIIDGLILIVTCVTIVLVLNNFVFAGLKKSNAADSLVTMIQQDNPERVAAIFEQAEYDKMKENKPATLDEYKKMRANKADEHLRTPLMWLAYANNKDSKFTEESIRRDQWESCYYAPWYGR